MGIINKIRLDASFYRTGAKSSKSQTTECDFAIDAFATLIKLIAKIAHGHFHLPWKICLQSLNDDILQNIPLVTGFVLDRRCFECERW